MKFDIIHNRMKRNLAFILTFFSISFLHAQIFGNRENIFRLTVEPVVSYTNGVLKESIYRSADKSKKISLLEWERNFFECGANVSTQYKKIHLDFEFLSSFPKQESGEMKDSDWQNPDDYSMKTTYSVGTNNADGNYDLNLSIFYEFEPAENFFISPKIQCQYMYDSFYRKKGSKGWYGQADSHYGSTDGKNHWWYDDEARQYPYTDSNGKTWILAGIDYFRHSFFCWAGFSIGFRVKKFRTDFDFLISPYTYFSTEDRHHTAGEDNVYHEIQDGFFTSFKFDLNFSYAISRFFDLTFSTKLLVTENIKGDLYIGWSKKEDQPTGASVNAASARLGCKIKIR